jgi:hydrogenase maturation factor HypF (carbamoyltransferase family)
LKKKTKTAVRDALSDIFKISKRQPHDIFADRGREFINSEVLSLLKRQKIKLYHSFSHLKAFQAERAIRTLKAKLYRFMSYNKNSEWLSALEPITKNINHLYNRSIKMAPVNVSQKNLSQV